MGQSKHVSLIELACCYHMRKVVFKWRHFGKYTGVFTDRAGRRYKGNGQMVSSSASYDSKK